MALFKSSTELFVLNHLNNFHENYAKSNRYGNVYFIVKRLRLWSIQCFYSWRGAFDFNAFKERLCFVSFFLRLYKNYIIAYKQMNRPFIFALYELNWIQVIWVLMRIIIRLTVDEKDVQIFFGHNSFTLCINLIPQWHFNNQLLWRIINISWSGVRSLPKL